MTNRLTSAAAAAIVALGLIGATAAVAKDVTVVGERDANRLVERVSYKDLNLAAKAGQDTLERRVRRATHTVCTPFDTGGINFDYRSCRNFAWEGAEPQMARAFERARQLAATGRTDLPEVAIAISAPASLLR